MHCSNQSEFNVYIVTARPIQLCMIEVSRLQLPFYLNVLSRNGLINSMTHANKRHSTDWRSFDVSICSGSDTLVSSAVL